ncbi:prephenate dehydratase [Candidatus Bathyarchaeota archaeon]|nr:prephenate dehydratase [Candidatus Bathyarchaeota archaeon]
MDIKELRKQIDRIDSEVLRLLKERVEIAKEILKVKRELGMPLRDIGRERRILERIRDEADRLGLNKTIVETIFKEIIGLCLSTQRRIRVAYLGPRGSFTEEAAKRFFHGAEMEYIPKPSIPEVFRGVVAGEADMGVVPVENSLEGSVNLTLDLLFDTPLKVCGEIELKVEHCLLANPGSRVEDIRVIFSHPQAIAQCRRFIETMLPQVEVVEVQSTSKAAEVVKGLRGAAAIASEFTADIYGLEVLAKSIQDYHDNYTRFFVLSLEDHPPTGKDKTSLIFSVPDKPGALYEALKPFAARGINLTKIESRPTRGKPWEYVFYMDMEGHRFDDEIKEAVEELKAIASFVKVLGSYPMARKSD